MGRLFLGILYVFLLNILKKMSEFSASEAKHVLNSRIYPKVHIPPEIAFALATQCN